MDSGHSVDGQGALVRSDWRPILQGNNQVVLYNPTSKALTVTTNDPPWAEVIQDDVKVEDICPYCHRPLDAPFHDATEAPPSPTYPRVPNYFHLLAESASRPRTPSTDGDDEERFLPAEAMADGYFDAFFREERKLGMGANGSVFLCQHVLDGNLLGHFAVKKIAVGSSHEYLVKILREVRLLEHLRHQNIVTYHHSWLETCRFSSFGPAVPTLFVLMQWAEAGSLEDFLASRLGVSNEDTRDDATVIGDENDANLSKAQRIAAFRDRTKQQTGGMRPRGATLKAVHLLGMEEIASLFGDVTAGLAFLHDRAVLHLDLKPGNVLLTWDVGALTPRAMLSDFGASRDMIHQSTNARTGITGTLEYTAPEILVPNPITGAFRPMDSTSDIWSLGIILHKLIFLHTPYRETEDFAQLQEDIVNYPGFVITPEIVEACTRRGLPSALLRLLETLLEKPMGRPTAERVLSFIRAERSKFSTRSRKPRRRAHSHSVHTSSANSLNTLVRASAGPSTPLSPRPNPAHLPPLTSDHDAPLPISQQSRSHLHRSHSPSPPSDSNSDRRGPARPSSASGRLRPGSSRGLERTSSSSSDSTTSRITIKTHLHTHSHQHYQGRSGSRSRPGSPVPLSPTRRLFPPLPSITTTAMDDDDESEPAPEAESLHPAISAIVEKTEFALPLPQSSASSLQWAIWNVFANSQSIIRSFKCTLLMVKIVSLSRYSNPTTTPNLRPNSVFHSVIVCLAAALAVADIWHIDLDSERRRRTTILISVTLAIVHIALISLLR